MKGMRMEDGEGKYAKQELMREEEGKNGKLLEGEESVDERGGEA